ncbi:MAG: hypothetical protein IE917_03490 [Betaproteobacteria bacterium]|nr:hypothetical protein [Betaproteobacteria bacterium]
MHYHDLHPADIQALRAEPDLLILDIRDAADYARGCMDGAEPASDAVFRQLMKSRQRERPVLVYCYHGNSSRGICQFIAGFGYTRVYNLVGGWQGWMQHRQAEATTPSAALAAWLLAHDFPADRLHARIDNGMSPLMLAALKGERALVEELLALGADPNHVNDDDHHALWFACVHGATCAIYTASTGKLDVLKRLVEAGADLSRETTGGYTALDSASTLPVLKYLRGGNDINRPTIRVLDEAPSPIK